MALRLPSRFKLSESSGYKTKVAAEPFFKKAGRYLYKLSYFTGKNAIQISYKIKKAVAAVFETALSEVFKSAVNAGRNVSEFKRSRAIRGDISVTRSIINFGTNIFNTVRICKESFIRGGFKSGFAVAGRYLKRGISKFFADKKTTFNYITPVAAIFVLVFTIYFWSNQSFALSVSYSGKNLGVVASEQIYRNAADKVEQNVSDASGTNFSLNGKVTMNLVLAKKSDLLNEDQIYNNIVMKSCDGVKNGYGLYVDNRLAGADSESGAIEAMLSDMTKQYKNDPDVQSVEFNQNVSIKSGLFPESVFKPISQIKDIVTGKSSDNTNVTAVKANGIFRISLDPLYAMNLSDGMGMSDNDSIVTGSTQPRLTVKVVKNEMYDVAIPYSIEQTTSDKLKDGKTVIKVSGQNGVQQIVSAVSFIDGVEVGENILSSTVTKQPVNQEVVVGTKKSGKNGSSYSGSSSSGVNIPVSPNSGGLIGYARSAIGVRYVSGGTSFSGFDCSGLTSYVYSKYGVSLPHSAAAQSAYGSYVDRSNLQQGDLVFFDTNGGHNNISHVGIYIGGGQFIDASSSRPHAVTVDSIDSDYYSSRYMTARRVLN